MEIKINREIRDYTESIFFGLSARQFGFSFEWGKITGGLYSLRITLLHQGQHDHGAVRLK